MILAWGGASVEKFAGGWQGSGVLEIVHPKGEVEQLRAIQGKAARDATYSRRMLLSRFWKVFASDIAHIKRGARGDAPVAWGRAFCSGSRGLVLADHLPGKLEELFAADGLGDPLNQAIGAIHLSFLLVAQRQHRKPGQPGTEFGNKFRTAEPGHVRPRDDQRQLFNKLRLFNQAKGFRAGNASYVGKELLQSGLSHESLQWIIVDEKNDCHSSVG